MNQLAVVPAYTDFDEFDDFKKDFKEDFLEWYEEWPYINLRFNIMQRIIFLVEEGYLSIQEANELQDKTNDEILYFSESIKRVAKIETPNMLW